MYFSWKLEVKNSKPFLSVLVKAFAFEAKNYEFGPPTLGFLSADSFGQPAREKKSFSTTSLSPDAPSLFDNS